MALSKFDSNPEEIEKVGRFRWVPNRTLFRFWVDFPDNVWGIRRSQACPSATLVRQ